MLTAFRITYNNGTSYITDMAAGVTLEMAQNYFLGETFEVGDDSLIVVKVEQVK